MCLTSRYLITIKKPSIWKYSNLHIFDLETFKIKSWSAKHSGFKEWHLSNPSGNLQPTWYLASTTEGFAVLARYWHKHDLPPARLRRVTWLEVVHRYWRGTGQRYHASTEICTSSVLVLLVVSRHLVSGLELYYASTVPTLGPRTNCTVQALFLVYNWRGTLQFVNTDMNLTFPPRKTKNIIIKQKSYVKYGILYLPFAREKSAF